MLFWFPAYSEGEKPMIRATPDSPRMFDSDLVNLFSRTHPAAVLALYVPGSLVPFAYGLLRCHTGVVQAVGLFVAGFVTWTLTEYWLHRLAFHFEVRSPIGERFYFLIHGVHHKWPRDKYRLVMPPAVSLTLYVLFGALFLFVFGMRFAWPFFAGFVAGYLLYDMSHYAIHHFRPRTRYGRRLKRHHMLHHFMDSNRRYGVSTWVWDSVFGTLD